MLPATVSLKSWLLDGLVCFFHAELRLQSPFTWGTGFRLLQDVSHPRFGEIRGWESP